MITRFGFVPASVTACWALPVEAAPTPRGQVIAVSCSGAVVVEGRKAAKADDLKHGQNPQACFGKMQIYDGPNHQFVVVARQPVVLQVTFLPDSIAYAGSRTNEELLGYRSIFGEGSRE